MQNIVLMAGFFNKLALVAQELHLGLRVQLLPLYPLQKSKTKCRARDALPCRDLVKVQLGLLFCLELRESSARGWAWEVSKPSPIASCALRRGNGRVRARPKSNR